MVGEQFPRKLKWSIFSSSLAYRSHVFGENGHRKRIKEKWLEKTADILRREIKCRLFSQAKKKEAAVVYYTITRM